MKKQKGITLIALVITIIVLLILAAVSITALTDEDKGVVTKAKQAASKTETAADEEDADIKEIIDYADSEDWGNTGDTGTEVPVPENPITFTLYDSEWVAEEGMTWEEWCTSPYNTSEVWYTPEEFYAEGKFSAYFTEESLAEDGVTKFILPGKICIASDDRVTVTGYMFYDDNDTLIKWMMNTNGVNAGSYCVLLDGVESQENIQYADDVIGADCIYEFKYW